MMVLTVACLSSYAGVSVSYSAFSFTNSTTWPGSPVITVVPNPLIPATNNGIVLEGMEMGRSVSQVFSNTVDQYLDAIAVLAGGPGSNDVSLVHTLHLFALTTNATSMPTNYIPQTQCGPDLFIGNPSFVYPPQTMQTATQFVKFTFTDVDRVHLAANTAYAFEIWSPSNLPMPGVFFWLRTLGTTFSTNYTWGSYECPGDRDSNSNGIAGPSDLGEYRSQLSAGHRECLMAVYAAAGGNQSAVGTFVSGAVPDWNQPYRYNGLSPNGGPGADPNHIWQTMLPVDQWNDWCAPCSGANLAGHWADARGVPVADGTAFTGSDVMWANGPSWQDYLADGTANRPQPQFGAAGPLPVPTTDVGWYMDTDRGVLFDDQSGNQMGGYFFGNGNHPGTYLKDIHAGLQLYLNDRYSAAGSIVWKTGTRGVAFAAGTDPSGNPAVVHPNAISAFNEVMSEINSNRTLIVSFKHWGLQPTGYGVPPIGGASTESDYGGTYYTFEDYPSSSNDEDEYWSEDYNWESLGHAVTAVGYIPAGSANDIGPTLGIGQTDWVIVHDNWASTPRNVIVPYTDHHTNFLQQWVANVTAVPWAAETKFVSGLVPDWNQPYQYAPAPQSPNGGPGADPNPNGVVNQWNDWCAPASGANLTGHWADRHNTPVADNTAFPGSDVSWAVGASWQDYLADGTTNRPPPKGVVWFPASPTDIGWYMDTDRGVPYDPPGAGLMGGYAFGNANHAGTYLKDIHAGLQSYLNLRFNPGAGWLTGTAGKLFAVGKDRFNHAVQPFGLNGGAAAFNQVVYEISHNRTLLLTYKHWNVNHSGAGTLPATGQTNTESGFGGVYYEWGMPPSSPTTNNVENEAWNLQTNATALGHVVTAVGYIQAGNSNDMWQAAGLAGPTDWVIVHDNWASTERNVVIPFDFANNWVANTIALPNPWIAYFTNIFVVDPLHLRIGFVGVPGATFDLVSSGNLPNATQSTNNWAPDMSNINYSSGTIWITNAIQATNTQRFYRIKVNY